MQLKELKTKTKTPWSRVLPERLTDSQLLKKFPAFQVVPKDQFESVAYVTCLSFYGEELLPPRPNPKLEDHPLSAVRDCLFNILKLPSISALVTN